MHAWVMVRRRAISLCTILVFFFLTCPSVVWSQLDETNITTLSPTTSATTIPLSEPEIIASNSTGIDYETENILALRWKIALGGVSYEGLTFDLHYNVSDYIEKRLVAYSIYDGPGCSASANFITQLSYFKAWVTEDATPVGGGLGVREITLSTQINATSITQSRVYTESNSEAQINFCVRLSLYNTDTTDPMATEINYYETAISLVVDLQDEFAIQSQVVEPKDKGVETASDAFFLEAFVCTEKGLPHSVSEPFRQGEPVMVCVQPTAQAVEIGFRMRSIERFTFWQGYVSQEAIVAGKVAVNGLTDLRCDPGVVRCIFETLLTAAFFQGPSTVEGSGFASLQMGSGSGVGARRRLRSQIDMRPLQQHYQQQQERDLKGNDKSLQLESFQIERVERHVTDGAWATTWTWSLLATLLVTMHGIYT